MIKLKQGSSIVKMGSTDAAGHYVTPNVQAGRTCTIVPTRNGYSFTPENDTFTLDCSGNATGHDFTATSVW